MDKQQEHGQYRKKPIVIEAWRIDMDSPMPRWVVLAFQVATIDWCPAGEGLYINTLEGHMRGNMGDWLIQGVAGELYACKPDIFAATYEPATPTAITAEEAGREGGGWLPIDSAPIGKQMLVVQAFDVTPYENGRKYTSDPYCVWQPVKGHFERWPHPFDPTHYMKLPPAPAQSGGQGK